MTLEGFFRNRDYSWVWAKYQPGDGRVYARVLRDGSLDSGDAVQILTADEALILVGSR